jgi:hypothetical protein
VSVDASTLPCADCGLFKPIMVVLRAPTGDWRLCSTCHRVSLRAAEEDRKEREAKLAEQEARERKPHNRERVGSH